MQPARLESAAALPVQILAALAAELRDLSPPASVCVNVSGNRLAAVEAGHRVPVGWFAATLSAHVAADSASSIPRAVSA